MTIKEQVLDAMNGKVDNEKKNFQKNLANVLNDFEHFFIYQADIAYKSSRMINIISDTMVFIQNQDERVIPSMIQNERDYHLQQLVNGQVITSSTNHLYNLSQNYERQINQELYKFYAALYASIIK